jgi:hypothetical protein
MDGCCRNHCVIDENASHCIHCILTDTPTDTIICEDCGIAIDHNFEGFFVFVETLCPDCVNLRCRICGLRKNPGEDCENCYQERSSYNNVDDVSVTSVTATDAINYFHDLYQHLAPTMEEQMQRLSSIGLQLCEECKIPCKLIWCDDCGFN